ncbi:hypothetical protein [Paraburkholderia unamae]|uniref:Holin (3TMs family) n=1 Tax=Paraburkholderia unamae TaxID=219649 RepID=A0ABX5KPF4_9BURK|nr:hypothetical protein [Paraburkholderia unamae]PVX84362.1 hypothetical protein C7402_105203 [Paraburkholderia unamae]
MSTWGDVASAVSKFAPILGNAVPGVGTVVGAGVGLAASVIAKALGTDPTPDSVMTALASDPDAIVKLRQAEMDHEKDLASIAAQREAAQLAAQTAQYQADAADRQSARSFAQSTNDHTARNLAYLYTVALFLTIGAHLYIWVAKVPVDPLVIGTINTLEGVLVTMAVKTSEFFTGGSRSADQLASQFAQFATTPGTVIASSTGVPQAQVPMATPAMADQGIPRGS